VLQTPDSNYLYVDGNSGSTSTTGDITSAARLALDPNGALYLPDAGKVLCVSNNSLSFSNPSSSQQPLGFAVFGMRDGLRFRVSGSPFDSQFLALGSQSQLTVTFGQFNAASGFDALFANSNAAAIAERDYPTTLPNVLEHLQASNCQLPWLNFVWHFTGGFLSTLAVVPLVATSDVRVNIYGIIFSSQAGQQALQTLLNSITQNGAVTAGAVTGFLSALYEADLLPQIITWATRQVEWWAAGALLAELVAATFAVGPGTALVAANFSVWGLRGLLIASDLADCMNATPPQASAETALAHESG
jgi:hypothetical protein